MVYLFQVCLHEWGRGRDGSLLWFWCKWNFRHRSVCYPVPSEVYVWDRDRQVPPYRHSRHWGLSRNWQRQRTLWRNYGLSQHLRSTPWWCSSSQTMPGWLWPSGFVFWSCLSTFTSHCNPTLYLPLLTPGERFISQETPCQFSRNSWRKTTLKWMFRLPTIFVSTMKLSGIYLSKV